MYLASASAAWSCHSAAGHVGGDGDRAEPARLGDDRGLALVLLGVEHLMVDAALVEQFRQALRRLHRRGADEHGLPLGMAPLDLVGDGGELGRIEAFLEIAWRFARIPIA